VKSHLLSKKVTFSSYS